MIAHSHNVSLVAAAIAVSLVAAFTGLALTRNIGVLPEAKRKAVVVMSAFVIGGGIWSMHFLAMLAYGFSVPVHYDFLQTLGSALVAILVVGAALLILHFSERTPVRLTTAGLFLGTGIVAMHFMGMLGMRGVILGFNSLAVLASLIVALCMGVAAIWVSYGSRSRQNIVKGGLVFGLSVVLVHFTAMIGMHIDIDPEYQALTVALDQSTLAIAVTLTAFVICGSFLLASATFVTRSDAAEISVGAENLTDQDSSTTDNLTLPDSQALSVTDAPAPADIPPGADLPVKAQPIKVPFEQNKKIEFVTSDDIAAIRADGRYTQIYTRDGIKFCPWSISEAENRLSEVRFYRSHRSYLINVQAVAGFERNRDAGICRFDGYAQLTQVPVSRTRVGDLETELGL